jgi:hypothetical protein
LASRAHGIDWLSFSAKVAEKDFPNASPHAYVAATESQIPRRGRGECRMLSGLVSRTFNPHTRGLHAVYREGETNHCPGCARTHWLIGRATAECAFCATALPLEQAGRVPAPAPTIWHKNAR